MTAVDDRPRTPRRGVTAGPPEVRVPRQVVPTARDRRGRTLVTVLACLVGALLVAVAWLAVVATRDRDAAVEQRDNAEQSAVSVAGPLADLCATDGAVAQRLPEGCATAAAIVADPPAAGADGADGRDGAPGTAGRDGTPGARGADGLPGAAGAAGTDGADGVDGVDGEDGAAGEPGQPGADGVTPPCLAEPAQCRGADGTDGAAGERGAPGAPGTAGRGVRTQTLDLSVCTLTTVYDDDTSDTTPVAGCTPQTGTADPSTPPGG